jgi:outer membrane immunogenic protein
MKKFVVAVVASAACYATTALASPPAAPAFDWTGFYVGGNFGTGVAKDPSRTAVHDPVFVNDPLIDIFTTSPRGAFGGGQIGYNWQAAPHWVWGIEADIQASGETDSTTCVTVCGFDGTQTHVSQKLPWFGTLRGRLGWANGPALYYATGGWAFGKVVTDYTVQIQNGLDFHNFNHTQSGWTIGGGIETQLAGNWTAKIEYLYMNLGNVAEFFLYTPFPASNFTESSAIRNHVVRIGLNYKFGDPLLAPTAHSGAYNAPAYAGWTGLYLGGNVGYGVARDPSQQTIISPPIPTEFFDLNPSGVLGGGQIGYNWQAAPNWVWGLETDIQANAQTDSTTCVTDCLVHVSQFSQFSQRLPWFGTLRGRLGWTNGPALYYATGGWAFGKVTTVYDAQCCVVASALNTVSHTQSGWTIGGGIETQLAGNWTAKIEYLYMNLGNVAASFNVGAITYVDASTIRNSVVRIGLNYKFGTP